MTLDITLTFPDSAEAAAVVQGNTVVRRYELREAMSALFELTVEVLLSDPAVDERAIVGQTVVVGFGAESFLKEVRGLVRLVEQRTAVQDGASLYVWTIVPPLWLTTLRRDNRIFQDMSAPEVAAAVLADPSYAGHVPSPDTRAVSGAPKHEYVVQYAESDWQFLSRILAAEGIASYFDHANASTWTLTDDTTAAQGPSEPIPFSDPSAMNPVVDGKIDKPHVLSAVLRSQVSTSAVTLRDYDFEKPDLLLEAKKDASEGAFENEHPLEIYAFAVGRFNQESAGEARAQRRLDAYRAARRRVRCTSSFALSPGSKMTLVDHPRADLSGEFLVVSARVVMEQDEKGKREIELMDLAQPFRPPLIPKKRIHGTQTAFVVGAEGQEIDVDKHGRVEIEFRWDRRDKHTGGVSRRVRVSQGWAGADRGFVALPRVKDEVIVAYLDGDPDEPIIVGRVHNGLSTSPLHLPADKAISAWRSKSTPGGNGYNEILMDDQAGAERLTMHAQRDFKHVVERDSEIVIGRHEKRTVKGNRTSSTVGNDNGKIDGDCSIDVTGALDVHAKTISVGADEKMSIVAGGYMHVECFSNRDDETSSNHKVEADALFLKGRSGVQITAPKVHVFGGEEIHLGVGGSTIHITAGGIEITSSGAVQINGSFITLN